MHTGKTIFSQVMDYLPLHEFRRCVKRYRGHYMVSLYTLLQILSVTAFEKISIYQLLRELNDYTEGEDYSKQLKLFEL